MKGRLITAKMIVGFKEHLILEERSTATIQKYIRDVKAFAEYARLCQAAQRRHNERLNLILQTICGTGIRVSELQFITVEAEYGNHSKIHSGCQGICGVRPSLPSGAA